MNWIETHEGVMKIMGIQVGFGEGDPAGVHKAVTNNGGRISNRRPLTLDSLVQGRHNQIVRC